MGTAQIDPVGPTKHNVASFECQSCGQITFHEDVACCGAQMRPINPEIAVEQPDQAQLAQTVFGISSTELSVCQVLFSRGEATVKELTGCIDRDRSSIHRHLNHLDELGFVTKKSKTLDDGGRVNVYSTRSPEKIRRKFIIGVYAWLEESMEVADDLSEEKIEAMLEQTAEDVDDSRSEIPTTRETGKTTDDADSTSDGKHRSLLNRLLSRSKYP